MPALRTQEVWDKAVALLGGAEFIEGFRACSTPEEATEANPKPKKVLLPNKPHDKLTMAAASADLQQLFKETAASQRYNRNEKPREEQIMLRMVANAVLAKAVASQPCAGSLMALEQVFWCGNWG